MERYSRIENTLVLLLIIITPDSGVEIIRRECVAVPALPPFSICDALSPLTDVRSPRKFNCEKLAKRPHIGEGAWCVCE